MLTKCYHRDILNNMYKIIKQIFAVVSSYDKFFSCRLFWVWWTVIWQFCILLREFSCCDLWWKSKASYMYLCVECIYISHHKYWQIFTWLITVIAYLSKCLHFLQFWLVHEHRLPENIDFSSPTWCKGMMVWIIHSEYPDLVPKFMTMAFATKIMQVLETFSAV